jgi:plasmid stability protein
MDTTIRNLDEDAYRALKARAALAGATVGEMMSEAIRVYVARFQTLPQTRSLRDLVPEDYPEGNERLSEEIDRVGYGA